MRPRSGLQGAAGWGPGGGFSCLLSQSEGQRVLLGPEAGGLGSSRPGRAEPSRAEQPGSPTGDNIINKMPQTSFVGLSVLRADGGCRHPQTRCPRPGFRPCSEIVFVCSGSFSRSTSVSIQSLSLYHCSLPSPLLIQRRELTVRCGKYWAGAQASGAVGEPLCVPWDEGQAFQSQDTLAGVAESCPYTSAVSCSETDRYLFFKKKNYYFLATARRQRSEKIPYFHYICKSCCTFASIFVPSRELICASNQLILMHDFALLALLNENTYQQCSR